MKYSDTFVEGETIDPLRDRYWNRNCSTGIIFDEQMNVIHPYFYAL